MKKTNGGCDCGAIEFSCTGKPINSIFCYCKECQKLTGSDKWFGLWFPKDSFNFIKGKPSVLTRKGDSGKDLHQMYCSDCGVTLCAEVTVGNFYSVSVSTLNEKEKIKPAMLIYTSSAPKTAVFPEGIPKFDTLPPRPRKET